MDRHAAFRVLLVEDEPLVAVLAEDMLDAIGCTVVATLGTVAEAEVAIDAFSFDFAMVDINLGGEDGFIVATALRARSIPYLITTGYDTRGAAPDHPDAIILTKPYALSALEAAIVQCTCPARGNPSSV